MEIYGKELIIDLHDCYETRFNRKDIKRFFNELCALIDMEQCKLTWWDYFWYPVWFRKFMGWMDNPKTYGTSAVQFIMTSNITIHVIDQLKRVYLNIFSCKDFDEKVVLDYAQYYFGGKIVNQKVFERI